jgi:valyl-tRNA synthetase
MLSTYPAPVPAWEDAQVDADMAYVQAIVTKTRAMRADYGLTKEKPPLYVAIKDARKAGLVASAASEIATLSTSETVTVLDGEAERPAGCGVAIIDETTTVLLGLAGVLDAAKEVEKLVKREAEALGRVEQLEKKMAMAVYKEKTPPAVQAADEERLEKMRGELEATRHHLEDMRKLMAI